MKASENKARSNNYELIAAISLGILALGSFALQAFTLSDKTTKLETVLFSTLQFLLTVGFGWFSTRAVSRNEFESSLKRFAVSAYRRISDIEDMVQRLQSKIATMRSERSGDDCGDLDIVGAIVEDTVQVVNSSMADWADVIGDELLAMEAIKHLETEKSEIKAEPNIMGNTGELDNRVQEIDGKINELIASLPARLQYDTRRDENLARNQRHAAEWMVGRHNEDNGLNLKVIAGGEYKCERDPTTLELGETLYVILNGQVDLVDQSGVSLGRALNNSPLIYPNFANALAMCYGTNRIAVEFVEIVNERKIKGKRDGIETKYTWYKVKVIAKPVYRRQRIPVNVAV
ncbi:MAG TPA: hypothetical protein VEW46_21290 [Pyrinomonadaceae bacterium]|nr:hypothetical protein [Pyrinomonadaceae bacterium]